MKKEKITEQITEEIIETEIFETMAYSTIVKDKENIQECRKCKIKTSAWIAFQPKITNENVYFCNDCVFKEQLMLDLSIKLLEDVGVYAKDECENCKELGQKFHYINFPKIKLNFRFCTECYYSAKSTKPLVLELLHSSDNWEAVNRAYKRLDDERDKKWWKKYSK